MLTDLTWNWLEPVMDGLQDMGILKEKHNKYLIPGDRHNRSNAPTGLLCHFDHNKHDVEQFSHHLKVSGKMISMSVSKYQSTLKNPVHKR